MTTQICYTCGTTASHEWWTDTGATAVQVLHQLGWLPWYCTGCAAKYEADGLTFALVPEPARGNGDPEPDRVTDPGGWYGWRFRRMLAAPSVV